MAKRGTTIGNSSIGRDPERSQAMMGNKNASKDGSTKLKANRLIIYKTGLLGNFDIGKPNYAFGNFNEKTGMTVYFDPKTKKVGLPSNTTHIRSYKVLKP